MKKLSILSLLSTVLLTGCTAKEAAFVPYFKTAPNGLPTYVNTDNAIAFTTYLMMSPYGRLDGVAGADVEDERLENCIAYESGTGGDLPDASLVTSTVGATFKGWAYYTNKIYPEYLTKVPETIYDRVYAIFEGGNGNNEGDIPEPPAEEKITVYFANYNSWGSEVNVYCWNGSNQIGAWPGVKMTQDAEKSWLYSLEISNVYASLIFNDGTNQTDNLSFSGYSNDTPCWTGSAWEAIPETNPHDSDPEPDTMKVYFNQTGTNITGTKVNAYCWKNSVNNGSWPGQAMTSEGSGLFSIELEANKYAYIIFNNGSAQTDNIELSGWSEDTPCYTSTGWSAL